MTIRSALGALETLLGDRLARSKAELVQHGQSESHFAPLPPDAVAYPETTDEVAALAVHLASPANRSITGAALSIDGGWTAR